MSRITIMIICLLLAWTVPAMADSSIQARAEDGDAKAQFGLGWMYREGVGMPQDNGLAAKWFRKAADQGDAKAQYYLGVLYDYGQGVPLSGAEAVKWWKKAAGQGDTGSLFMIGNAYFQGDGVRQDYAEAWVWLTLAEPSDSAAAAPRDLAAKHLDAQKIQALQKRVDAWRKEHKANGS